MNAYAAVYQTPDPVRRSDIIGYALLLLSWGFIHAWALANEKPPIFTIIEPDAGICMCGEILEQPKTKIYTISFSSVENAGHLTPAPDLPYPLVYLPVNHFIHYPTDAEARRVLNVRPDEFVEVVCEPTPNNRLKHCVSDHADAKLARATEKLFETYAVTKSLKIKDKPYHLRMGYFWDDPETTAPSPQFNEYYYIL